MHRKSRRQNFRNSILRNLFKSDAWREENTGAGVGDYGAGAIENKANERDITTLRTHQLNVASKVKKMIAPLTDLRTKKDKI